MLAANHRRRIALGLCFTALSVLLPGAYASGSGSVRLRFSGAIQIWLTPGKTSDIGRVLITGAIGDYGKTYATDSKGKHSANGLFEVLVFSHGSILINGSKFAAYLSSAVPHIVDGSKCSATLAIEAPVPIKSGTGDYGGITGSITLTQTSAYIFDKSKSGSCAIVGQKLEAEYVSIYGAGRISYD
jgi:hypothetical protein